MRNYYNYFTEVEEHFIRRRGKSLLVSPLDWCLIEVWKETGVPLHVALRGIDQSFESAERRSKRAPTSLFYCHPAVLEALEEYQRTSIGGDTESTEEAEEHPVPPGVSRQSVLDYLEELQQSFSERPGEGLARVRKQLADLRFEVTRAASLDFQRIASDLERMDQVVLEALKADLGADRVKELAKIARQETKIYRKRLSPEMYSRLEQHYLARKIREACGVPELSLYDVAQGA